eukprot:768716-Hanusia_phi.AAC.5
MADRCSGRTARPSRVQGCYFVKALGGERILQDLDAFGDAEQKRLQRRYAKEVPEVPCTCPASDRWPQRMAHDKEVRAQASDILAITGGLSDGVDQNALQSQVCLVISLTWITFDRSQRNTRLRGNASKPSTKGRSSRSGRLDSPKPLVSYVRRDSEKATSKPSQESR